MYDKETYDIIRGSKSMNNNQNMTSKDKNRNILINGEFKVCNIPARCSGTRCDELCTINQMIKRLYKLEHGE